MAAPYARKKDVPDTYYLTFKAVRSARDGSNSASTVDNDTGKSPVSRWLAYAFDYADFTTSNPDATGWMVKCQLPRHAMVLRAAVRVDTAFVGTGNTDIDIGDGSDTDGWVDGGDFSSTGLVHDPDAVYNWAGTTAGKYYGTPDTVDILFKNATAPTAGEAILFLECISYHEELSSEW